MSTGETAQATCLVSSGDQPLEITWSFENNRITDSSSVSVSQVGRKTSLLLIDPVQAEHRGNYTCTVRNSAGVVNFTATLRINGKLSLMELFSIVALPLRYTWLR